MATEIGKQIVEPNDQVAAIVNHEVELTSAEIDALNQIGVGISGDPTQIDQDQTEWQPGPGYYM